MWVFFKFGSQQHFTAQPGEVLGGHAKIALFGIFPVAKRAVDLLVAIRPPATEYGACTGDDDVLHMGLSLRECHFRPGQPLSVGAGWPHGLGITGVQSCSHQSQQNRKEGDAVHHWGPFH